MAKQICKFSKCPILLKIKLTVQAALLVLRQITQKCKLKKKFQTERNIYFFLLYKSVISFWNIFWKYTFCQFPAGGWPARRRAAKVGARAAGILVLVGGGRKCKRRATTATANARTTAADHRLIIEIDKIDILIFYWSTNPFIVRIRPICIFFPIPLSPCIFCDEKNALIISQKILSQKL